MNLTHSGTEVNLTPFSFLSKTDFTTRTLTIYEGVNYGFELDAFRLPKPSNLLLFLVGVIGVSVARIQRKRKRMQGEN